MPIARPRLVRIVAVSVLAAACFSEDPNPSGDGSATTTTTGETSSGSSADSSNTLTSSDATSVADTTSTSNSDGTADSTTGPLPECGCPGQTVWCDGFEEFPGEWDAPPRGGGSADQDMGDAVCGAASGLFAVVPPNQYAALVGNFDASVSDLTGAPYSVGWFMRADSGCAEQGDFVRVLEVQLPQVAIGDQWYRWDVAINGTVLRLTATDYSTGVGNWMADLPAIGEWTRWRLDFDLSAMPPTASLWIDDLLLIDAVDPPAPELPAGAHTEMVPATVTVGPYFYLEPFAGACTIRYDDVWAAPMD